MRSLILSAVLGLTGLGLFAGMAPEAQAQRRGRDGDRGRGWYGGGAYVAPYYGGYYGYRRPYYSSSYYARPTYNTSYYYDPDDGDRYSYYWSNGWHICYDRQTGEYWYESPANSHSWYRWR